MDIRRFLCVGLAVFGVAGLLGCVHDYACADSCESGGYWFEKACGEYDKDNLELAGDFFHEALQAYEACRDSGREQALCSRNIAVVLLRLAEKKEREEQKESGWLSDLSGLGVFSLTIPRDSAGCYEKAIEMSEKALALYQGVADVEDEKITCFLVGGSARLKVGERLASAGKFDEAKSILERALEGFRRVRDTNRQQAACHAAMGVALSGMGRHDDAVAALERARNMYQAVPGTEREQARCCAHLGDSRLSAGKFEEAAAHYDEACKLLESVNGSDGERAVCYTKKGSLLETMGRHQDALATFERALDILDLQWRCNEFGPSQDRSEKVRVEVLHTPSPLEGMSYECARCYQLMGISLHRIGKLGEAIESYRRATTIYEELGRGLGRVLSEQRDTRREMAECHRLTAEARREAGEYEEAIADFEEYLRILEGLADAERERARCSMSIGETLDAMGKHEDAMARYEQVLKDLQAVPHSEWEQAACMVDLGLALGNMGLHDAAIVRYERALGLLHNLPGSERDRAVCLNNMGASLCEMGSYEDAIARHEQALNMCRAIQGAEPEQARSIEEIGNVLTELGRYDEAISRREEALRIYQTLPSTERQQARCMRDIGVTLGEMGRCEEAVSWYEQALKTLATIQTAQNERWQCYLASACSYLAAHRGVEAVAQLERAAELGISWELFRDLARAYQVRGAAGDDQKAVLQLWRAVRLAEVRRGSVLAFEHQAGLFEEPSRVLPEIVNLLMLLAAKQATVSGLRPWENYEESSQSRAEDWRDIRHALSDLLARAEWTALRVQQRDRSDVVADVIGDALRGVVDFGKIGELLHLSHSHRPSMWDSEYWEDPRVLAFHFADRGKARALLDALRQRASLRRADGDASMLTEDQELARSIGELASRQKAPATSEAEREELAAQIQELQERRNVIEAELKRMTLGRSELPLSLVDILGGLGSDTQFRDLKQAAQELPKDTAVLQYSIGEKTGWLLILTRDGLAAYCLKAHVSALPELLPRQVPPIHQLIEAWKSRQDDLGLDGLVRLARERVEDMGQATPRNLVDAEQERRILECLGGIVLPHEALSWLGGRKIRHLVIIPDGSLHYVPFAMLRVGGNKGKGSRFLIEQFALSYVPAMSILDAIRDRQDERTRARQDVRRVLLAFANPVFHSEVQPVQTLALTGLYHSRADYYRSGGLRLKPLPETEAEASDVASLFGPLHERTEPTPDIPDGTAVVYARKGACEEQVKRLLVPDADARKKPGWQYLLFSTHGFSDTRNGMLSCVVLSTPDEDSAEDGFLQAHEVLNMDLDTDLVMLSACQTGLGRLRSGEGLVGLSAAFFCAGAKSVCASLWSVPSRATKELVTEFFKRLRDGNTDRAEALRQAQLAVMRSGDARRDPWHWAAFVLMGDYR